MSSDASPIEPWTTVDSWSSTSEVTMALNSRTLAWTLILIHWVSLMSSQLRTRRSRMASWNARIEHSLRWLGRCSMNTRLQGSSGLKLLILHAMSSTMFVFISFWRKHPMNSSLVRSQMSITLEYLVLGAGSRIHITLQNLHRKHMKVLCLVKERIRTPTESSISFIMKWLKQWMCGLMRLTVHKESTSQMC